MLKGSVGRGGTNRADDTLIVQLLLNDFLGKTGATLLKLDGIVGPLTIGAIEKAQRHFGGAVDGRVDPKGRTLFNLVGGVMKSAHSAMSQTYYGKKLLEDATAENKTANPPPDPYESADVSYIEADLTNAVSHMVSLMRAHLK
jgi:hypothetical protein